jgi:hypothetical protein
VAGKDIIVTVNTVKNMPNGGTFKLNLSNIKNSFSLKTTDGFGDIKMITANNYLIAVF